MTDIKPYGESAILIEFENRIAPEVHDKVLELTHAIRNQQEGSIISVSPAYNSVLIQYNPLSGTFEDIRGIVQSVLDVRQNTSVSDVQRWRIPVCYDQQFALDKEEICKQTGLSWEEVIALHCSETYRVYMLGFLPGFGYMGIIPDQLQVSRRSSPRQVVPGRSVGIAGRQTAIYPMDSPGGWQIAGRTPVSVFLRNTHAPVLLNPGDQVSFYAIDMNEFLRLEAALKNEELKMSAFHAV